MDAEALENYEAEIQEQREAILSAYASGELTIDEIPASMGISTGSLSTAYNPLLGYDSNETVSLWDILPFYDTVCLTLDPSSTPDAFEDRHGFAPDEVTDVIDLAEAEIVQPVLDGLPRDYLEQGLDFLEPLFDAVEPPLAVNPTTLRGMRLRETAPDEVSEAWEELQTVLTTIDDVPWYKDIPTNHRRHWQLSYAILRADGFDELADDLIDQIQRDPGLGLYSLDMATILITDALNHPLKNVLSMPRNLETNLQGRFPSTVDTPDIAFPGEIGSFLLSKTAPQLPDRHAATTLRSQMDTERLYRSMQALQTAIEANDPSDIDDERTTVRNILDEVWEQAQSIETQRQRARAGLSISFVAAGTAAGTALAGPAGTAAGFLTSLGLTATEYTKGDDITDRLISWRQPGYLMTVYDMQGELNTGGEDG